MPKAEPLSQYKAKRNFAVTTEPSDGGAANTDAPAFVIQKHWASRLHYDFRLELDGAMKSWAVPKGPSFDPRDKRMAVHVEDHPISYNKFEGTIPPGQYGAGKVIIWDKGTWQSVGDARRAYRDGKLKFELRGHKLRGKWALVRMKGKSEKQDPWLLIKEKDEFVRPADEFSVVDEMPDSVAAAHDVDGADGAKEPEVAADQPGVDRPAVDTPPADLPDTFQPELATLVDAPPKNGDEWLYEIKFDGYRLLARIQKHKPRLYTRNGHDWTGKLKSLSQTLVRMKLPDGWYDGEIVVLDEQGLPSFQALQGAFDAARTSNIVYYLFDLPFCNGSDLRRLPLVERRDRLAAVLEQASVDPEGAVRFSDTFDVDARHIVTSACKLGLEGVIGKKKTSPYVSRRSGDWIKLKCSQRQEFVIGGYTEPQGSRSGIGSLLLGVHDDKGNLRYAGNVGTGFSAKSLDAIRKKLDALKTDTRPFQAATGMDKKAHWGEAGVGGGGVIRPVDQHRTHTPFGLSWPARRQTPKGHHPGDRHAGEIVCSS